MTIDFNEAFCRRVQRLDHADVSPPQPKSQQGLRGNHGSFGQKLSLDPRKGIQLESESCLHTVLHL